MRITFYTQNDQNCSRWRGDIPLSELTRRGYQVHTTDIWDLTVGHYREADVAILQRPVLAEFLPATQELQRRGQTVLAEVDDLLWTGALPPHNPAYLYYHPRMVTAKTAELLKLGVVQREEIPRNSMRENLVTCMRACDGILVTTPELEEQARRTNPRVYVAPNLWDSYNPAWEEARTAAAAHRKEQVTILFAGSYTHRDDVALLRGVLEELVRKRPQVKVLLGPDRKLLELFRLESPRYMELLPPVPFDQYPHLLARADIILAPLVDCAFNRCKSWIRVMEAGALGLPWVGSPLPSYKRWGAGGILCERPRDWLKALLRLVDSPEERWQLGQGGLAQAQQWSIAAQGHLWEEVLTRVIRGKKPASAGLAPSLVA